MLTNQAATGNAGLSTSVWSGPSAASLMSMLIQANPGTQYICLPIQILHLIFTDNLNRHCYGLIVIVNLDTDFRKLPTKHFFRFSFASPGDPSQSHGNNEALHFTECPGISTVLLSNHNIVCKVFIYYAPFLPFSVLTEQFPIVTAGLLRKIVMTDTNNKKIAVKANEVQRAAEGSMK